MLVLPCRALRFRSLLICVSFSSIHVCLYSLITSSNSLRYTLGWSLEMKVENVKVLPRHIMIPHEKFTEKKFRSDSINFYGAT